MSIKQAFDYFMAKGLKQAVDASTIASRRGSGYSVELFPDGSYQVNPWIADDSDIYYSSGLNLTVPALSNDDWAKEPGDRCYAEAEKIMREWYNRAANLRS